MFKVNAIGSFVNVFQNPHFTNPKMVNHLQQELEMKGKWKNTVFKNGNPLTLELACGKGDYTLALAQNILTEIILELMQREHAFLPGLKLLLKNLSNIAFARMRIENILNFF